MRIVFFGTPLFAVPTLNALLQSGEEIPAVVTQPDKKKGRGHLLSQPPVKELAIKEGVRIFQPASIKDADFLNELSVIKPELIVVVAYGRILPESIINLPANGCVNVHASLLPKYRGAAPISWVIINGEEFTGVTTMLMDKGIDTGDILLEEKIRISDEDTTETLSRKLSGLGASLLLKTIKGIKEDSIKPRPQTGEASYAPIIKKEDGLLNWSKTAIELFNFVRGMYPWPCAYCYLGKERIKIIKVRAFNGQGKPGRIERALKVVATRNRDELVVGTDKGLISIIELQPEGKKVMSAGEFIRGRNIREGQYFDEKQMD
ncbi:MAG: methionyl-tRNA formyltransferase [Thermodesulfovibrionales bacterium]|nr:methionyl-tRNA formyltransferase [Thermodesulfovibrionales bacterium]